MATNQHQSPIQTFYSASSVFVTGATGFLGKCLLEKLLRTCPDLRVIYVLVREKRGKAAEARLAELFADPIFDTIKEKTDKYWMKVVAMVGDVQKAGLGLSQHDRNLLEAEVNVVFHVAATVKFDEPLKIAVAINVNGTREMLELAKCMRQLKAIIHVSTAYSNCHIKTIEEQFYKYPMGLNNFLQLLDNLTDKQTEELTPQLLGNWPNSYTFTKAMAESLIVSECSTLPIGVFRPAIIVSTWKEPVPGWIDNIYGPTGICAGAIMGVIGSIQCDEAVVANIVPVDMTVNALISCAWDTARKYENHEPDAKLGATGTLQNSMYESPPQEVPCAPPVYNYVSSVEKPINWGEFSAINMLMGRRYPLIDAVWYMNFQMTKHAIVHTVCMIMFHLIPALIFDGLSILSGRKPRLTKIYRQADKLTKVIAFFATRDWTFCNSNVQRLWYTLDEQDKKLFFFNIAEMNWLEYMKEYVLGIRLYLHKQDLTLLTLARRRQTRLFVASKCLKIIFYSVLMYTFLYAINTIVKNVMYFVRL